MGCPPQEFLIRMRLTKATELMKTSSAPIGEISTVCGYSGWEMSSPALERCSDARSPSNSSQTYFHGCFSEAL